LLAGAGSLSLELAGNWLLRDVLYRIVVGGISGVVTGWLLGRLLFAWPKHNPLAATESGVIALAGVLLAYGGTELVEGYGFIAVFVAGLILRRQEAEHEFHRKLHDFLESLEHALTALLLVALGAAVPVLLPYLGWGEMLIGVTLIIVIRPLLGWLALIGTSLKGRERLVVAAYGVRGIGSIYYLGYAGHHAALVNEATLWAIVAFTILLSTLLHGLTAGIAVERVTGEAQND
jgi:sodium/hydrogen antiporter